MCTLCHLSSEEDEGVLIKSLTVLWKEYAAVENSSDHWLSNGAKETLKNLSKGISAVSNLHFVSPAIPFLSDFNSTAGAAGLSYFMLFVW